MGATMARSGSRTARPQERLFFPMLRRPTVSTCRATLLGANGALYFFAYGDDGPSHFMRVAKPGDAPQTLADLAPPACNSSRTAGMNGELYFVAHYRWTRGRSALQDRRYGKRNGSPAPRLDGHWRVLSIHCRQPGLFSGQQFALEHRRHAGRHGPGSKRIESDRQSWRPLSGARRQSLLCHHRRIDECATLDDRRHGHRHRDDSVLSCDQQSVQSTRSGCRRQREIASGDWRFPVLPAGNSR